MIYHNVGMFKAKFYGSTCICLSSLRTAPCNVYLV